MAFLFAFIPSFFKSAYYIMYQYCSIVHRECIDISSANKYRYGLRLLTYVI